MRYALILCAALVAGPVSAQADDQGFLTRFLQDNLSSAGRQVQITGFQGALSSRSTIAEMTIADGQGVWLTLRGVTLDWNRAAVLRGVFSVNELTASEVIVDRPPVSDTALPSPEAKGFSLPELPISVDIGKLAADRLELGPTVLGAAVKATLEASLHLAGGEGQAKLSLRRTDDGPEGALALDASYSNASRILVMNLDASEAAGGIAATRLGLPGAPETRLTVQGEGVIDDFAADIHLSTDGVDRLSGKVTLTAGEAGATAFTANLGGNPAPLFLPDQAEFFGDDVRLDLVGQRSGSGALDLSRLLVKTKAMALDGTLRLAPDGLPERFALNGRIAQASGAPVLLPFRGTETRISSAEIALNYDPALQDGWTGKASVTGLSRSDLSVDGVLLTGSGRIGAGPQGNVIGATLRMAAAGIVATDPALAQAVGGAATGQVKLAWQEGQPLRLSDLSIAGSDYTATTRGRISGLAAGIGLDGRIEASARDLSRFSGLAGRALSGRASLTATGKGSLLGGDFDLDGAVTGDDLTLAQAEVDGLLRGTSQIAFSVARTAEGTEIRHIGLTASTLSATASGTLRSTGSDLSADLNFSDLRVLGPQYRGGLTGTARFTGTATNGQATLDATGSELSVGQAQADTLLRGKSSLSVALRTADGTVQLDNATLANPQVRAEATGRAAGGRREITVSARLTDLALLLPDFPGPLNVAGTAIDDGAGYRVDLRGSGPGQIDARLAGRVDATFARADLTIAGSAQAALANPFIAPRTVGGPVTFDLRLNGPLTLQSLSGRIALANGRVAAPVLRFALEAVNGQAVLAKGSATISADAAVTAGGRIGVRGTVGLTPPFPGDLTITPTDMVLRDPDLYETRASGDIRVSGPLAGGARISGTINLPEVEIRVPSTDVTGAGAIPDLTHLNEPAAVRATRARAGLVDAGRDGAPRGLSRPYLLDLVINAPNRVFIRGRGLDAELGGSLRLAGTSEAVVPSGGIDLIRGRLDILGRRLDLSEAQLRLEGSLDPLLHVVASNSSEGITSSVVIDGPISAPEVSFTSSPELPEEEVLAHLLFGRQLSSLSALQAVQLANAVAVLAGRGGDGIISNLRRNFGLDDFDVVNDASGGTSLRLGRYVAKNLYTEVIVGSEGKSQLNLNLDVRPGVTVRGTAGSDGDTGIGIFVEHDY